MNPVVRSAENNVAFVDFFDTAIDTRATPLPPKEERTVPVTIRFRPGGQPIEGLFEDHKDITYREVFPGRGFELRFVP